METPAACGRRSGPSRITTGRSQSSPRDDGAQPTERTSRSSAAPSPVHAWLGSGANAGDVHAGQPAQRHSAHRSSQERRNLQYAAQPRSGRRRM